MVWLRLNNGAFITYCMVLPVKTWEKHGMVELCRQDASKSGCGK
jgi:hypothetical protein